jgi:hypothetical protein
MAEEIDSLLSMTERIREMAATNDGDEKDWGDISALIRERQDCLERLFADGIAPERVEVIREMIKRILQEDVEISRLIEAKKRVVAEELAFFAKGRNAQRAYLNQLAV